MPGAHEAQTLSHAGAAGVEPAAFTLPPAPPPADGRPADADAPRAPASMPGYEVLDELGRGGMGVVYKARDTRLGRLVALKMVLHAEHAGPAGRHRFRDEARAVARLYGPTPAERFGPLALEACRAELVKAGYCRRLVNQMCGCVRACWRWGSSRELVPHASALALGALAPLRRRRTAAPDHPEIRSADPAAVEATLPQLGRVVAAMVRLQLHTGMRPGEACALRPCDLVRPWKTVDGVPMWLYKLDEHKGDWRGLRRWVPLGPAAQAVLGPFLDRDPAAYCFSPAEAAREWLEAAGRRWRPRRRRAPGAKYTTESYGHAVAKAVARANRRAPGSVAPWAPNQLRHLVGTQIEAESPGGREDARCVLGHKSPSTTAVYAEQTERAARVLARRG
jgi:integrase